MRTAFNGFDRAAMVSVRDGAMLETAGYEETAAEISVTKLPFDFAHAA
jgi:hypothetical protein